MSTVPRQNVQYGPLQLVFDVQDHGWYVQILDPRNQHMVGQLGPFGDDLESARFEALVAAQQYLEERKDPIPSSIHW